MRAGEFNAGEFNSGEYSLTHRFVNSGELNGVFRCGPIIKPSPGVAGWVWALPLATVIHLIHSAQKESHSLGYEGIA